MEIYTLGKFEIKELRSIKFSQKEAEIITYISLNHHKGTFKINLINDIWFYSDEIPSKNEISVYISKINKKLKNIAKISCKKSKIYIYSNEITIDAITFEKLSNEFLSEQDTKIGENALELYKGKFLEGFDNNWIENLRFLYENLLLNDIKLLLDIENDPFKKILYLEKLAHIGTYENIAEILNDVFFNKFENNEYIPYEILNFLVEKDKLLRNPKYIVIDLTLEKPINLFKYTRKGDIVSKKGYNHFVILFEKKDSKNPEFEIKSFINRLKKSNIKIKKLSFKI